MENDSVQYDVRLSEEEREKVNSLKKTYTHITDNLIDELNTAAENSLQSGRFQEAFHTSELAIAASKYLKNPLKLAQSWGTFGNVLVRMDQLEKALHLYLAAASIFEDDAHRAILYGSIGNIYLNTGGIDKAFSYHEAALEIGERNGFNSLQIGALINLGIDCFKTSTYEKALEYLNRALVMSESSGDVQKEADIHTNIGAVMLEVGNVKNALYHLKKAFDIHNSLSCLLEQASDSLNIGNIYYERGTLKKALFWYAKSRNLCRKIGSPLGEAHTSMNMGNVFLKMGHTKKALKNYEVAQTIYAGIPYVMGEADAYANRGTAYGVLGDIQRARECHEKAQFLYHSIHYTAGEAEQFQQLGSLCSHAGQYEKALHYFNQSLLLYRGLTYPKGEAGVYIDLGLAEYDRGNFTKALECAQRALTIYESIHFAEGIGRSCGNSGNVLYSVGEYEQALHWYDKALKIYEKQGFQREMANVFLNKGNVLYSLGKMQEALKAYEKALDTSSKVGYRKGQIEAYSGMGVVYSETDAEKGISVYEKALSLAENYPLLEASLYLNEGVVYVKRGDLENALSQYSKSLQISQKCGYIELEAKAYLNMGRLYDLEGEYDKAFQCYENALSRSELVRDRMGRTSVETRLAGMQQDMYEMVVVLALEMHKVEKAFHYIERAKSRTLVRLLRKKEVVLQRYDTLMTEELNLENEIDYLYYQILEHGKLVQSSKNLLEKSHNLTELQKSISRQYADFAEIHFGRGIELKDVKTDAQILEYFMIGGKLLTLFISGSDSDYYVGEIPSLFEETLSQNVSVFLKYSKLQSALYRAFVKPFEDRLDDRVLCIVPHGFLYYFPFGALFDGERYLIEKHRIAYAPSVSVLKFCLEKNVHKSGEYLVLGQADGRSGRMEAQEIAELWGIECAEPRIGVFMEKCSHKELIHVACHGQFVQEDPLGSYIEFQDGKLEAQRIFNLDLEADLVVLSACESGVNKVAGGDELMGLTRAFLFAGAKSLVHTLWPVYGVSTRELMVTFYKNLKNGQSKLDSLRNAQLEMLHNERFKNPFYWGPFVLMGDWH